MRRSCTVALLLAGLSTPLFSQESHSRYAEQGARDIKALPGEEIEGLLNGDGMGLALAAELNGYPGARHVLDLADALELSPEQLRGTREIFSRMQGEARRLGAEIVHLERALDREFAERTIDRARLSEALERLAELRGRLRYTHLSAHLSVTELLTHPQRRRYQELRGYR